jgi:hypothetical protein
VGLSIVRLQVVGRRGVYTMLCITWIYMPVTFRPSPVRRVYPFTWQLRMIWSVPSPAFNTRTWISKDQYGSDRRETKLGDIRSVY